MKATHYIKEVKKSQAFKEFMQEYPDAYLCSLFFTRDLNGGSGETQVDFYSPKKKMIVSFKIDKGVERVALGKKAESLTHKKIVPKPLSENIKMDIDEIEPTLMDEMHNRGMTYQIEKVLAFLNITDDRILWNCTAFLRGLGLLIAHVEDKSKSVLFMDKKSFFDLVRFTGPPGQLPAQVPGQIPGQKIEIAEPEEVEQEQEQTKKNDAPKKDGNIKKR